MLLRYTASNGICIVTDQATRDVMVRTALNRFAERKVEMTDDGIFVCRILVKPESEEMKPDDAPQLAVFILCKGEDGRPDMSLLLWSEAQERGIADSLLKLINHGGKEMFPNKVPNGET